MHIIQKNIIEIELPASEEGFAWQERISRLCEEKMAGALDAVFNEMNIADTTLVIDQVRIELGNIKAGNFEKVFLEAVKNAIIKELNDKISGQKQETIQVSNAAELPVHGDVRLFIYFLKYGVFPWWTDLSSVDAIERSVSKYLRSADKEHARNLFSDIFKTGPAGRRFILQFSVQFQTSFLQYFNEDYSEVFEFLTAVFLEITRLTRPGEMSAVEIANVVRMQLQEAILQHKVLNINTLLTCILTELIIQNPARIQNQTTELNKLVQEITQILQTAKQKHPAILQGLDFELLKKNIPGTASDNSTKIPQKTALPEEAVTEGIYIGNAGLVLLAPFLSEYLKACGVLENEELTDKNIAVHAMQYLVTGQQRTSENELVLNKILCGIPIETEVLPEVELPGQIKNEAKKMLEAVIFYWDILRDTSVAGLQNSFLRRGGKISMRSDGDWLLQVEQAGYDMLLAHLPWTYSIVKLPVMTKTLWVEWA